MEKFKKFEYFLFDNSWLFKLGIVLFWIVWATHLYGFWSFDIFFERDILRERIKNYSQVTYEEMIKNEGKLRDLVSEKIEKAKAKGRDYSPRDYFKDLKEIYEKEKSLIRPMPFLMMDINSLVCVAGENLKNSHFTEEQWEAARQEYGIDGLLFNKNVKLNFTLKDVFNWLVSLYLRSMFLVLLFYLVCMARENGILETILSDKKKFLLAVLLWPYYFTRYPSNIIKKILVEAELRRMGDIFRRLTLSERKLVRSIVETKPYREWVKGFRVTYAGKFQRGFALALLVTIFFYLFLPKGAEAKMKVDHSIRDGPVISKLIVQSQDSNIDKDKEIIPENVFCEPIFTYHVFRPVRIELCLQKLSRPIDHVPLCGCMVYCFSKQLTL